MATIVQISKIKLRTGPQTDLPGAPVTLSPLVFRPGLDLAEIAMASDTGRVFIGHDPSVGQPNYNRSTFPYRNIEILTENSTEAFGGMFGAHYRETTRESYFQSPLNVTGTNWAALSDERNPTLAYRLPYTSGISFLIEYAIYDPANKPVRIGRMRVVQIDGAGEPLVEDDAIAYRMAEPDVGGAYDASTAFNPVTFRFVAGGTSLDRGITIDYTNNSVATIYRMLFRISRPQL